MAYKVNIASRDEKKDIEKLIDIHSVDIYGEIMICLMTDMRTRLVRPLKDILFYEIIEQPIVNPHKKEKKK